MYFCNYHNINVCLALLALLLSKHCQPFLNLFDFESQSFNWLLFDRTPPQAIGRFV
jgi:hypothetical protein